MITKNRPKDKNRIKKARKVKRAPVVRIFPFIAPEADLSGNRLNRDIAAANEIFNWCGINVVLGAQPITLKGNYFLFSNNHPVDPNNNPFQNLRTGVSDTDLAVFYVGGDYLADRETIGNTAFRGSTGNGVVTTITRMIIMTNGARVKQPVDDVKYAFAHEVLHSLLARQIGTTVVATDPSGPYVYPNGTVDTAHNNDPNNLLYPIVPLHPLITQQQCAELNRSTLLK
jgi:hypothetical protein